MTPIGIRKNYEDQITTGVLIGSGIGGIEGIAETALLLRERGPRRVSPFFIPGRIINLAVRLCVDHAFAQGSQSAPWSPPARPARMPSAMPAG